MKQVWQFYNSRFNKKKQLRIPIDNEAQRKEFIQYWEQMYKDINGKNTMIILKDNMQQNYRFENIGLNYNDVIQATQGVNENKAVQGILKPKLLRLGNGRSEEIIYRIME